ncbi:hypothetical protein BC332_07852 [Capsicum chinense]|nr:hypothetical protein BC332_07852 [Capsicum chinense]
MLSFFSFSSYTYSNPKKALCTPKKGKDKSSDHDDLVSLVYPSFKIINLIEVLQGKRLSKKNKKSLCLFWFVHNVLWARDVNNNIPLGLIKLSEDVEPFKSYPWGYESFKMTVKYLLTSLTPKIVNLYGFPWAFTEMTSKRGVIPSKSISYPYTPLEIKVAKRRKKEISKASSSIEKSKITTPLSLSCTFDQCTRATGEQYELKKVDVIVEATAEQHNIIVDNPSSASMEEEKVELDCGLFIVAYVEYLSDGLQVPNDGLDAGLLRKISDALLWKYEEEKALKSYASDIKDPR